MARVAMFLALARKTPGDELDHCSAPSAAIDLIAGWE